MIHWSLQYPEGITKYTHIHQCKPQVCHIQHTLDWPQHAGETLLLADSIGAYCDTESEFLSADTKTDMWVTAAMIMDIYRVALGCLLVVGSQHNSTTARRKGHHTKFKTGGCSKSSNWTEHAGAVFLLYWRETTGDWVHQRTRILAKGTHNQGNTYPRVGGTHITVIHQGEQISPGAWPGICVLNVANLWLALMNVCILGYTLWVLQWSMNHFAYLASACYDEGGAHDTTQYMAMVKIEFRIFAQNNATCSAS